MTYTWKTLAQDIEAGEMSISEAANLAAELELPIKRNDPDGTIWYDGEEDNTSEAVYSVLSPRAANEFLDAVSSAL